VQTFVYNYLAPGSVEVDDVLLLPVQPPAPLLPAVGGVPQNTERLALQGLP
jgi:hypothetical protein